MKTYERLQRKGVERLGWTGRMLSGSIFSSQASFLGHALSLLAIWRDKYILEHSHFHLPHFPPWDSLSSYWARTWHPDKQPGSLLPTEEPCVSPFHVELMKHLGGSEIFTGENSFSTHLNFMSRFPRCAHPTTRSSKESFQQRREMKVAATPRHSSTSSVACCCVLFLPSTPFS